MPSLEAPTKEGVPDTSELALRGVSRTGFSEILTTGALEFLARLEKRFGAERRRLLAARAIRQKRFDAGAVPDFLPATRHIRDAGWSIGNTPEDLVDRRVEITGPTDRKMMINAFNSGANVFMADFEDATSPTWENLLQGQVNIRDYATGRLEYSDPDSGRDYRLGEKTAVLMVRPRGWHLEEAHVLLGDSPVSASLFDFGLVFFHNARALIDRGTGPYFYLPKLESHLEARLWNDVFVYAQDCLAVPVGTIKATVLIETLPAAFEMDEILYELKDHIVGLNCGRWDYIFSFIKTFRKRPEFLLPDRARVVMGEAFLRAYSLLLIKTCHRRGAHAMGGMAAQIPVRNDAAANAIAFDRVRADKEREVGDGHDGTWVAHPGLVPVAREVFDRLMPGPNQLDKARQDVVIGQADLLKVHDGDCTEAGLRENIRIGIQYIEAWLRGRGAVPLYNLMEDAATAEISRAQTWQWLNFGATLADGRRLDTALFEACLNDEVEKLAATLGPERFGNGRFAEAIGLFRDMSTAEDFEDFLTIPAYRLIMNP